LAISGLHLAHHRQPMRDHYLAAAIRHHQAASQAAIPLVLDATVENAQMLFLFSALTTYYGAPSRFRFRWPPPDKVTRRCGKITKLTHEVLVSSQLSAGHANPRTPSSSKRMRVFRTGCTCYVVPRASSS
jgi:hypothetical protein